MMRAEKLITLSKKTTAVLQKIEIGMGVACLFVLLVIIIANVVGRYVFYKPIAWSDELSNYLFIWMCFPAAAYVMSLDGHVRVTALVSRMPEKANKIIHLIMNIIMFITFFVYIVPSASILSRLNPSNAMRIPLGYIYFIIPFFSVLMCVHIINNVIQELCAFKSKPAGTMEEGVKQ
jgi:TRAP-type C4-dicarboxylate transport system permease small subunit